jgi:flagellar biosynthesis protein FliQ
LETTQTRSLAKETTETLLLLAIASLMLGGYVGLALFFIQAVG